MEFCCRNICLRYHQTLFHTKIFLYRSHSYCFGAHHKRFFTQNWQNSHKKWQNSPKSDKIRSTVPSAHHCFQNWHLKLQAILCLIFNRFCITLYAKWLSLYDSISWWAKDLTLNSLTDGTWNFMLIILPTFDEPDTTFLRGNIFKTHSCFFVTDVFFLHYDVFIYV